MVDITILELHLADSSLTANAPFSSGRKDVGASDEPLEEESSSSSKGKVVGALVGLVFLAVVSFVVKKKVLGGGGDEPEGEEFEVADVKA